MKYSLKDDYSEAAHPAVLAALQAMATEQNGVYGQDRYCDEAAGMIKKLVQNELVDVHFVSGGTQANLVALSAMLKPYEAVIAVKSAHILVHEAGAIEATGHKIIDLEAPDGKLKPHQIQAVLDEHIDEHMVKPRVVFVTQATELGTVYQKAELAVLSEICRRNNLYLYLDGARLGVGLTCEAADATAADIASYVDMFYIGGTKNGALFGEALVVINDELKPDFRFQMKQRGALLAKGFGIGAQFAALFTDDLYFDLATHANTMAQKLAAGIRQRGYTFAAEPCTNQIFPIFPDELISRLQTEYMFYKWQKIDDQSSAARLVTSWATPPEAVDGFLELLG